MTTEVAIKKINDERKGQQMKKIQIIKNNDFGEIRTIDEAGRILFCGSDVAKALGYKRPADAISAHCRATVKRSTPISGKIQEINFITEGDVYRLIVHSKLHSAEKFEQWVFDEVLPTLRKTGGYVSNEDAFINTYLPNADEQTKAMFKTTLETVKSLNKKIETDKPKVLFADSVSTADTSILIGDLAKLIKQNGVDIGQKRLFEWLRNEGWLIKSGVSKNMPTQKSMDLELFEVKERTISNSDGSVRITRTTKVTGKGQIYFIDKFLQNLSA